LAISVGLASMRQSSIPLSERAAHRCERPLRSSTRHSSRVSPLDSRTAPALKTLLIGYGQSRRLRIGLPEWRVNRGISAHAPEVGWIKTSAFDDITGGTIGFNGKNSFRRAIFLRWLPSLPAFPGAPKGTRALILPPGSD